MVFSDVSSSRWMVAAVLPLLIAVYGLKRKSLDRSGAIAGIVLAQVLILANYGFLAELFVFFIAGSRITKFRQHIKAKIVNDYKEGGGRNWKQVLCTGGVAGVCAVLYLIKCGSGETWMDMRLHHHSTVLSVAVLGSLSCANGDTFSSEIGTVVGLGDPWLITTFKRVPKGTNGGVSPTGTLASIIGGTMVGLGHFIINYLCLPSPPPSLATPQHCLVWLGALGGLLGSILDSILGATFQYSGIDRSGAIVNEPGKGVRHVSGMNLLSNHMVNLISEIITALLLPALLYLLY
uniref:Transmembrane protein 19 n=1 Tax=Hirondellea gigas TaxID=1518452 RepID=A0A2P2IBH4_9CRUS